MTRRPTTIALIALATCLSLVVPAAAERSVVVYKAKHRNAEELMPLAETALADQGSATLDARTNSLVLVGEVGAVDAALELLGLQDRPLRTIVVRHRMERIDELLASGVRIRWSAGSDRVRVGNIIYPDGAARVGVMASASDTQRRSNFEAVVRILEGETGRIHTGETVPLRTRGRWTETTTLVTAESGFEATPRVLGDGRIQVQLVPTQAHVDARGRISYAEAVTTVIASPGETVAIGGLSEAENTRTTGDALRSSTGGNSRVLLLTVEIDSPQAEGTGRIGPPADGR